MADPQSTQGGAVQSEERIPAFQHILDNPFLLLFIGIAVPTLTYIVWGIMELVALPVSSP